MPGAFHTLVYPAQAAASRSGLAFPAKPPGSRRTYVVDFAAWLADAGTTIAAATAACDASLQVQVDSVGPTSVRLTISGGDPAVPLPVIAFVITCADGDVEPVDVYQPVLALAPAMSLPAAGSQPAPPLPATSHFLLRDTSSLALRDGSYLAHR